MPVYNQEAYVAQAVSSILDQAYKDFEFVIVDDGSTDGTIEIIEQFDDPRIRLIRAEHGGFVNALRRATREAKGKWIARMDSDDISRFDRLERQMSFLADHPECVFVTSFYGIVTPHDKFLTPLGSSEWHYLEARDVTRSTLPFCDPGTIFDRELALEIGYNEEYQWEKTLWYELLRRGKGAVLEEPLYFVRWRMGSLSRGQSNTPADRYYKLGLEYDPDNVALPKEVTSKKLEFKTIKKCLYFYLAAGDTSSLIDILFTAWRRNPANIETYRLIRYLFGLRREIGTYGPAGVKLFPTVSPSFLGSVLSGSLAK